MNGVKLLTNTEEINELYNFIQKYPLNYPNYSEWLLKCKRELELGYKKALVYKKDNEIIGNLIFQPHKQDSSLLELKNGRVNDNYKRKKIFSKLIKQVTLYARENNFKKIIADAHEDNTGVIETLQSLGFSMESYENLYTNNQIEVVLAKDLTTTNGLVGIISEIRIKLDIIIESIKKLFFILRI